MINQTRAEAILLEFLNPPSEVLERGYKLMITSVELSPNQDYWVMGANTEAYVRGEEDAPCLIGVIAYLVNSETGEIELVGEPLEQYLEDKYDERDAQGMAYVLGSAYQENDKGAIVRLRQLLQCTLPESKAMIAGDMRLWLTGKKRILVGVVEFFREQQIETEIVLTNHTQDLPNLTHYNLTQYSSEADIIKVISKRITLKE
jgi:hypothetical protein